MFAFKALTKKSAVQAAKELGIASFAWYSTSKVACYSFEYVVIPRSADYAATLTPQEQHQYNMRAVTVGNALQFVSAIAVYQGLATRLNPSVTNPIASTRSGLKPLSIPRTAVGAVICLFAAPFANLATCWIGSLAPGNPTKGSDDTEQPNGSTVNISNFYYEMEKSVPGSMTIMSPVVEAPLVPSGRYQISATERCGFGPEPTSDQACGP